MGYFWNCDDDSGYVTAGIGGVTYGGVIQRPDSSGGYNVSFSVPKSLAIYHIHFRSGGTRVSVVRYKSGSAAEGNNIVIYKSGVTKNLKNLAYECTNAGFPNHATLLTNLANAIKDVKRAPNGELA